MDFANTTIYVGYVEKQITAKSATWPWFIRKSALNKEIGVIWQDDGENNYTPCFIQPKIQTVWFTAIVFVCDFTGSWSHTDKNVHGGKS